MKYVITGGAGNISKPLVEKLLSQGHQVTVIGRSEANLQPLIEKGATAAIGSVEDVAFLTQTFEGADAVYTMVPPKMDAPDWVSYIGDIGQNYADAIKASNVTFVVNLSSVGAHMPTGAGPVSGLYRVEAALDKLEGVNVKHLRPGYFYNNLFGMKDMIKYMNLIGSNFGGDGAKYPLVAPADIAEVAAEELSHLNFTGKTIRYIASQEISTDEIASALGKAINKPELTWTPFSDEQTLQGLQQAGVPPQVAEKYTEMGAAMKSGDFTEDYYKNRPASLGKTSLETFAQQFSHYYDL